MSSKSKAAGDSCVKKRQYTEALCHYNDAIAQNPTAALFSNRSLVHLKLGKYSWARSDALQASELDQSWAKVIKHFTTLQIF